MDDYLTTLPDRLRVRKMRATKCSVYTPRRSHQNLYCMELKKNCCSVNDEESQFHAVHQLSDGRHQDDEEEELVIVAGRTIFPSCF